MDGAGVGIWQSIPLSSTRSGCRHSVKRGKRKSIDNLRAPCLHLHGLGLSGQSTALQFMTTIQKHWHRYLEMVYTDDLPEQAKDNLRRTFLAGAYSVLACMIQIVTQAKTDNERIESIKTLKQEIEKALADEVLKADSKLN